MRFRSVIAGLAVACAVTSSASAQDSPDNSADSAHAPEASGIIAPELAAVHTHVLPKSVAGALTIKVVTAGQDGSFDFLSSVPGVASFRLTTFGGAANKSMLNVPPGAYTIVQTKNAEGFELQSVQCSDASFDGAAASVSIAGGASSTCTFMQAVAGMVTNPDAEQMARNGTSLKPDAFLTNGLARSGDTGAGRFARAGLRVASVNSVAMQQPSLP
jgi:hypothetical protein